MQIAFGSFFQSSNRDKPCMCGKIGQLSSAEPINQANFDRMRDRLAHRGPDGAGTKMFRSNHVAFGHRRLSIIDLSSRAAQPMANEDGTVWLVFNGEIYKVTR